MGYPREEVIGCRLTSFFSEESRRYAEEEVFPEFFKTGFIKDVAYQFVKKRGQIIDVLLSAIADRDEQGGIIRTLAGHDAGRKASELILGFFQGGNIAVDLPGSALHLQLEILGIPAELLFGNL